MTNWNNFNEETDDETVQFSAIHSIRLKPVPDVQGMDISLEEEEEEEDHDHDRETCPANKETDWTLEDTQLHNPTWSLSSSSLSSSSSSSLVVDNKKKLTLCVGALVSVLFCLQLTFFAIEQPQLELTDGLLNLDTEIGVDIEANVDNNDNENDDYNDNDNNNANDNDNDSSDKFGSLMDLSVPYQPTEMALLWEQRPTTTLPVEDVLVHCFHLNVVFSQPKFPNDETNSHTDLLIVSSHLADFDSTSRQQQHKMFTILRDPVVRTLEYYHEHVHDHDHKGDYEQRYHRSQSITKASFATTTSKTKLSLKEYLEYHHEHHNEWINTLVPPQNGNDNVKLSNAQRLETAKTLLRTKCIVGLYSELDESIQRFVTYFNWSTDTDTSQSQSKCIRDVLTNYYPKESTFPFHPQNEDYEYIYDKNSLDMELYFYATELFQQQQQTLFSDNQHN